MKLGWSHAVLNVRDLDSMLNFYTGVLGFTVSDRGPLGPGAPEIVFMSNDPEEHHQVAMVPMREGDTTGNPLNHLAFRVESFDDVKELHDQLATLEVEILWHDKEDGPGPMIGAGALVDGVYYFGSGPRLRSFRVAG